jgi:SagB-type dehydrogenase family enzyme
MIHRRVVAAALLCLGATVACATPPAAINGPPARQLSAERIALQLPSYRGVLSVEEALLARRSIREYRAGPLTLAEASQLLWAAQGVTDPTSGRRTAPSAGALYPLETTLVTGDVDGLAPGGYRYSPAAHELTRMREGDLRPELSGAALGQRWVREAAALIVLSAVYQRTTGRYGPRGVRYVHLEAGHAAQNVCLQAVALGLGAVTVGAFDDVAAQRLVRLPVGEEPLVIVAIGRK